MPKKTVEILDESGDKKYFTIVPNYILNHSTGVTQALYLQMKRLANDNEICYASEKYFMDKLGVGRKAFKNSLQYLLDHEWIKFSGIKEAPTNGGKQGIKTYKIIDLWSLNIGHYSKGVSERTPHTQSEGVSERTSRGVQKNTKGCSSSGQRRTTTKNIKKEHLQATELPGVNEVLGLFKEFNPAIKFSNKTQRKACESILKEKGLEDAIKIVSYASKVQGERYAPSITTPLQLWDKMAQLQIYFEKENKSQIQSL